MSDGFAYEGLRRAASSLGEDLLCWVRVGGELPAAPLLPALEPLTDGVLLLRASLPVDGDALWESATDAETLRWALKPRTDRALFDARLDRVPQAWLLAETAAMSLTVDGEVVGSLAVRVVSPFLGEVDLGYEVLPGFRGRGLAGRAVGLASAWALGLTWVHRVTASANVDNAASLRVLDRTMVREGIMRSYLPSPAGPRQDVVLYSLTRADLPLPGSSPGASSRS